MSNSDQNDDENRRGTGLSNEALGLVLAGLVLAWFLMGLFYAIYANYGGQ